MLLKPLATKLIVEVLETEKKLKGGIIVPFAKLNENFRIARVLKVGEKVVDIKEGDKILMLLYTAQQFDDNENLLVIEAEDVLAICEE